MRPFICVKGYFAAQRRGRGRGRGTLVEGEGGGIISYHIILSLSGMEGGGRLRSWVGVLWVTLALTSCLSSRGACGNSEGDALYTLRRSLSDPNNVLQSWDPTLVNPCTWFHVTCNQDSRVTRLSLSFHLSIYLSISFPLPFLPSLS